MILAIKNNSKVLLAKKNLCILFAGNITIETDAETKPIASKSFFFFDKPFEIIAASPYLEGFVIQLDKAFLTSYQDLDVNFSERELFFKEHKISNLEHKKNQVKSFYKAENKRLQESYLHILWTEFINDYHNAKTEKTLISQFSDLITQHIEQNYCAGTYAKMLNVPLKVLIREVKKSEHKTPCNFITEKVIQYAKNKLLLTEDTSQMIAYQLGFEDPYYFIKYFKKNTGFTPTQFRAQEQIG